MILNWCAVDPGQNGSFVWLEKSTIGTIIKTEKMPKTTTGIFELIKSIPVDNFIVEAVNLRPGDMEGDEKYAMYNKMKLFKNHSYILNCIELAGKKHVDIFPRTWQKPYISGITNFSKIPYQKKKQLLKKIADVRFPNTKTFLWNCDAILILDWIWQEELKQTEWLKDKKSKAAIK